MKRELGISLYPDHSDFNEDVKYMKKASELGYSRIFMSMLEVGNNPDGVIDKFKKTVEVAKKLKFEVIIDVSPSLFDQLNISYDDLSLFSDIGVDGIRLDEGFDGNKESLLTYNEYGLNIELNMSNNVAYLENILSYQPNKPFIYGCHNFYPQKGTGLPYDFFVSCSERFKKQGIKTAAFISSREGKEGPWDINDGLPTLEMHRNMPIELQAKHLFTTNLIDSIIIGNAYATDTELMSVSSVNKYKLNLTIYTLENINDVERKILSYSQHYRRGDISSQTIRSTQSRVIYGEVNNAEHDNINEFRVGDVVIGNDSFGKYKNELQIVLEPHKDSRKNLVGRIKESEVFLLGYIKPWTKFGFDTIFNY